jgi:hypothetical protein
VSLIRNVATLAEVMQKEAGLAPSAAIKKADLRRPPVSGVKPVCRETTGKMLAAMERRDRLTLLMVVHVRLAALALLAEVGVGANAS